VNGVGVEDKVESHCLDVRGLPVVAPGGAGNLEMPRHAFGEVTPLSTVSRLTGVNAVCATPQWQRTAHDRLLQLGEAALQSWENRAKRNLDVAAGSCLRQRASKRYDLPLDLSTWTTRIAIKLRRLLRDRRWESPL
jgi:hypothetical protein